MSKIADAISEINNMDSLAARDQWVNRIHPLVKLIVTVGYIAAVVSFQKYDVPGLVGMVVYPMAVFMLSELSFWDSVKRLRLVLPLILLLGILNPILDKTPVLIGGVKISAGVLSMLTLIMKGVLSVLASYLLIATTGLEKLCYSLRLLRVPKAVVTQLMLTYRYISVLLGEAERVTQAYSLRAPKQKGVHFRVWGSLTGQMLLRSMDRANTVFESMLLRGYNGEYEYMNECFAPGGRDAVWLFIWLGIIILFRIFPVILIAGDLMGGLF